MKKMMMVLFAALMTTLSLMAPADAASNYSQVVSCTGSNMVGGQMLLWTYSDGSAEVNAYINDGGASAPHNWDVWLYRNDTAIRTDHVTGDASFYWFPDNPSGLTDWKFRFANNARTINCTAEILSN